MQNLDLQLVHRTLLANSFREFVRWAWPVVSSDPFVPGYHLDAICEHLEGVARGQIGRLVINVAIRHSKSLLCSVLFPVWQWVRDPSTRIIHATYSKDLTVRDAVRSRQLIESDRFRSMFGHVVIADDNNRKDYYSNSAKGHRLSVSIGSRTSGFDADLVIADDIHDFATRTSEAERTAAIDYFEAALCSRLVYTGREAVVLAGHRVHEDDVYSRLRAKYQDDGTWTWLVLPEEYTPAFSTWHNAIGWTDRRQEGELLWPEKFSAPVVAQQKKTYRHEYSAIFQQEPTSAEGSLFRKEWFRYWGGDQDTYELRGKRFAKDRAWRFATVDTAISTSDTADWTVMQVWDSVGPHLVLVDQMRRRLDGTAIVPALAEFYRLHRPQFISVEREFVGRFVLDQLRERGVAVKAFDARRHGDKEQRAIAAEIRCEAGNVWFPADRPWVADLERELLGFPNAAHDDQVDCVAQACILADRHRGPAEPELTAEQLAERADVERRERFEKVLWAGLPF